MGLGARLAVGLCSLLLILGGQPNPAAAAVSSRHETLKHELEIRAVRFFLDHSHPATGLTRDGAENFGPTPETNRMASIASTGFSLAVIVNAGARGLISRDEAYAYALKTMTFARDHVPRRNGWFTHFLDWETGVALSWSEYSTIDTALFLGGALYAREIFPGTEVARIADQLYRETDFFDMLTDGGTKPEKLTLSMAYNDGRGYTESQWDMPAEQILLLMLGLGHPTRPLPAATWTAFRRDSLTLPDGRKLIGADMPLFIHQYSQVFLDLRRFRDGFGNYHENGALGTEFNRNVCRNETRYASFRAGFWGLSAGTSEGGYDVWSPMEYVSTVCIGCAAGSIMYAPAMVLSDIESWLRGPHGNRIWGRYGLIDSLDVDANWYSSRVLGITVGPIYMSAANTAEESSFWKVLAGAPEIERALRRAEAARARAN